LEIGPIMWACVGRRSAMLRHPSRVVKDSLIDRERTGAEENGPGHAQGYGRSAAGEGDRLRQRAFAVIADAAAWAGQAVDHRCTVPGRTRGPRTPGLALRWEWSTSGSRAWPAAGARAWATRGGLSSQERGSTDQPPRSWQRGRPVRRLPVPVPASAGSGAGSPIPRPRG
jgi:hypothetical protein